MEFVACVGEIATREAMHSVASCFIRMVAGQQCPAAGKVTRITASLRLEWFIQAQGLGKMSTAPVHTCYEREHMVLLVSKICVLRLS